MNNVNMSDIAYKIHFIYKDECEKNVAAMVIFYNNGKYFFDEKHENEMSNDEVEALLLRGALVYKDDEYAKPSSFNNSNISFGTKNTIALGNYIIQFNEKEDTLDFLYNGVIDEPILEEISLSWVVGNLNSSGAEVVQDNALRSDFVAIKPNCAYSFYLDRSLYDPTGVRVYFYDVDKAFISRTNGADLPYTTEKDIPIDLPSNAAYMRFKSNIGGTTSLGNINTLFILRKRKNYITEGLSMYIDASDVATHGSIRDITGNHTITNHGTTITSDNNYLNFIASESDYLDTDFTPNLTQWSVELYFHFTKTPTTTQYLVGCGVSGNRFRIAYSSTHTGLTIQSNADTTRIISDNSNLLSPHHLIVTMNNGALTSYLDGVKTVLCTNGSVQSSHESTLKIGTKYDASKEFANINLRMFRFYDGKALTDEEALQNYNYELNRVNRDGIIISPTWNDNKSIVGSNGGIIANDTAMLTDPIEIDNNYNYTIRYNPTTTNEVRIAFYDSSQTFISRTDYLTSGNVDTVIAFPENTAYFRIKAEKVGITVNEANDNIIIKKVAK